MAYLRLHSQDISPYTGERYGIFVAVWHLVRDERVTDEEAAEYWRHREWFEGNLPIPPFYAEGNPDKAVTWFKRNALTQEMKTRLGFYHALAAKYGVGIAEQSAESLANIIHEDTYQVAVV